MNYTILGILGLIIIICLFKKNSSKEGLVKGNAHEFIMDDEEKESTPPAPSTSTEQCDGLWKETKGLMGSFLTDCSGGGSSLIDGKCGWQGPNAVDAAKKGCYPWESCGGFTCMPSKEDPSAICYAAGLQQSACLSATNAETHDYDSFHKLGSKCSVKPQDCVLGEWEEWSKCSATCGKPGSITRSRKILLAKRDGGKCEGALQETKDCVLQPGQIIQPDIEPDYTQACLSPPEKQDWEISDITMLDPAPTAVSMVGAHRPTKPISNPASLDEDYLNRVEYAQEQKNSDLVKKAMEVSVRLKDQKKIDDNDPVLGRDYSKPDLRTIPLLKSISDKIRELTNNL